MAGCLSLVSDGICYDVYGIGIFKLEVRIPKSE
jgi:hypothetical protein